MPSLFLTKAVSRCFRTDRIRKPDTGTAQRIQSFFKIKQPVKALARTSLVKTDKKGNHLTMQPNKVALSIKIKEK